MYSSNIQDPKEQLHDRLGIVESVEWYLKAQVVPVKPQSVINGRQLGHILFRLDNSHTFLYV